MNHHRQSAYSVSSSLLVRDLHSSIKSPRKHYQTDRLPQTSMIRKVETNEEQNESPLKLEGWLYVNLYRGLINTADRSVRLLKAGDIKEAIKFWERARLFLAELSKRENISDENRTELKILKIKYKEHAKVMNQIKIELQNGNTYEE